MADEAPQYYWCTRHSRVETEDRCRADVLMGPYPSAEAAANYAETAKGREDAWAADDERWEGS